MANGYEMSYNEHCDNVALSHHYSHAYIVGGTVVLAKSYKMMF